MVPYYIVLYYTLLYYTVLYYTILYYVVPYCIIVYYTYYTILYAGRSRRPHGPAWRPSGPEVQSGLGGGHQSPQGSLDYVVNRIYSKWLSSCVCFPKEHVPNIVG